MLFLVLYSYYVPESLRDVYLEQLLPLADIVTPNVFESHVLSLSPSVSPSVSPSPSDSPSTSVSVSASVTSIEEALAVCTALHRRGPSVVILTGLPLSVSVPPPSLSVIVSIKDQTVYRIDTQMVDSAAPLSGCGDLFSAFVTGGLLHVTRETRERQTETQTETQTGADREKQREMQKNTERQRETDQERERERETLTENLVSDNFRTTCIIMYTYLRKIDTLFFSFFFLLFSVLLCAR